MSSIAASSFAVSQRTLADLRQLAEASPAEAQHYLEGVAQRLPTDQANPVRELLEATGSLVDRLQTFAAKLGGVFAPAPDQWGALQAARSSTLGWSAEGQAQTTLTGRVKLENGTFILESPGLRPLKLAEGNANETLDGIPGQWVFGLMDDMELRLKGTLGNDGLTFNVTGYAPAKPGYEEFVMARVNVEGDDLFLRTPSGQRIEVTDPGLRAQFKGMHRLAVILPGAAKELGVGKQGYDGNPGSYFALGRFRETTLLQNVNGTVSGFVEMAHEAMKGGEVRMDAALTGRVSHTWRVWLEGSMIHGAPGERPTGFAASYVSKMVDTVKVEQWTSVPLLPRVADAGPVDAARELATP